MSKLDDIGLELGQYMAKAISHTNEWYDSHLCPKCGTWVGPLSAHACGPADPSYTITVSNTGDDTAAWICFLCGAYIDPNIPHTCPALVRSKWVTGYTCLYCGAFVAEGQKHVCPAIVDGEGKLIVLGGHLAAPPTPEPDLARGWICPRCHKVWGPLIANCDCRPEDSHG